MAAKAHATAKARARARRVTTIVKYNGILARRQIKLHMLPNKVSKPVLHYREDPDLHHWNVPKKPTCINKLMEEGRPIGTKWVGLGNQYGGEPYLKYNGSSPANLTCIAKYLLHTTEEERKNILEKMLMNCMPIQLSKILLEYRELADNVHRRSTYWIATGEPVICDNLGILR